MGSDELGEVINRYASMADQPSLGQGPGEDGEEGTGPSYEERQAMHAEIQQDRYFRAAQIIHTHTPASLECAKRCVEALRREGLL